MGNWEGKCASPLSSHFLTCKENTFEKIKSFQLEISEETEVEGNAFSGVTSHTLSMPLSIKIPLLHFHHNTVDAW